MKLDFFKIQNSLPLRTICFKSIDSTRLFLKRQILSGEAPYDLVISETQTNGQGRVGKSFYSPSGTGLYLTFCFELENICTSDITPRVATAVCHSIENYFPVSCGIKWVNDIYISGRKVAGILCQNINKYCLIGIGINVERPEFVPVELQNRFGFITEKVQEGIVENMIQSIYFNITDSFSVDKNKIFQEYCARCIHLGKKISVLHNDFERVGTCVGISEDFSLSVVIDGICENFSSGVMSIID